MKSTAIAKTEFGKQNADAAARNEILEKFIQDCGKKAFRFAYRLTSNAEDAKELVQEALYRVMLAWDRYDQSRSLKSWFFTVLWNAFIDSQRRVKRWNWIALDAPVEGAPNHCYGDSLSDGAGDLARYLERAEDETAIRQALERLMPDYRAVIDLWQLNGMSYKAIAGSLGVPVGTVRSRVCRARRALRKNALLAEMVE